MVLGIIIHVQYDIYIYKYLLFIVAINERIIDFRIKLQKIT